MRDQKKVDLGSNHKILKTNEIREIKSRSSKGHTQEAGDMAIRSGARFTLTFLSAQSGFQIFFFDNFQDISNFICKCWKLFSISSKSVAVLEKKE